MSFKAPKTTPEEKAPGCWWEWQHGGGYSIMFKCPECLFSAVLATPPLEVLKEDGHRVLPGGHVTPSVACNNPGCTFHVTLELEGYVAS